MCLQEIITRKKVEGGWEKRGREKLLLPPSFCAKRWLQTCNRVIYLKIHLCSREFKVLGGLLQRFDLAQLSFQQTQITDKQKRSNVSKYTECILQPRPIISMQLFQAFSAGNREKGNKLPSHSFLSLPLLSVIFLFKILLPTCYSLYYTQYLLILFLILLILVNSDPPSSPFS